MAVSNLADGALKQYNQWWESYNVEGLDKKQLTPKDIHHKLQEFSHAESLNMAQVGSSFLKQPIYQLKFGNGPIKVFAWSQMHGDESTATASILDLVQFLISTEGQLFCKSWWHKISLYIVPMLNPDGAAQGTRVNAQSIDINRDACKLQSPEGQLLHSLILSIKPDFAFNLHDQNSYYAAGNTANPATLSFMAPPAEKSCHIGPKRLRAMQLIGELTEFLRPELSDCIGRYDDSFSSRAFGDFVAAQQVSCILIESGAHFNDINRQIARRTNFLCYLRAIELISTQSIDSAKQEIYHQIPANVEDGFTDVFIKSLTIDKGIAQYQVDISIRLSADNQSTIYEVGDLQSQVHGFCEFDASNCNYLHGEAFLVKEPLILSKDLYRNLLQKGFIGFIGDLSKITNLSPWPIVDLNRIAISDLGPMINNHASWLMAEKGAVRAALLDGHFVDLLTQ